MLNYTKITIIGLYNTHPIGRSCINSASRIFLVDSLSNLTEMQTWGEDFFKSFKLPGWQLVWQTKSPQKSTCQLQNSFSKYLGINIGFWVCLLRHSVSWHSTTFFSPFHHTQSDCISITLHYSVCLLASVCWHRLSSMERSCSVYHRAVVTFT